MSISRDDVARAAGVGTGTVSRAFNKPHTVADDTRRRILRVAKEMGYHPNSQASNLRRKDNGQILIIDNLYAANQTGAWENYSWLWATVDQSLRNWSSGNTLDLNRVSVSSVDDLHTKLKFDSWAGIALLNIMDPIYQQVLQESGYPYIQIGTHTLNSPSPIVMPDEISGSKLLAEHLSETGHTKPLMLSFPLNDYPQRKARYDGFKQVMPETVLQQINIKNCNKDTINLTIQNAIETMGPDCVYSHSSALAARVCHILTKLGFSIGKDISMVCYDNAHWLKHLETKITTVDNQIAEVVDFAMNKLWNMISHEKNDNAEYLLVQPKLILGESVMISENPNTEPESSSPSRLD